MRSTGYFTWRAGSPTLKPTCVQIRSHVLATALSKFGSEAENEEIFAILRRSPPFDTAGRIVRKREERLLRLFSGAQLSHAESQAIQDYRQEMARARQIEKPALAAYAWGF